MKLTPINLHFTTGFDFGSSLIVSDSCEANPRGARALAAGMGWWCNFGARGVSDNNVKRPVFIRVQRLDQSLINFLPRPILTHCSDSKSSVYIVGSCGER